MAEDKHTAENLMSVVGEGETLPMTNCSTI